MEVQNCDDENVMTSSCQIVALRPAGQEVELMRVSFFDIYTHDIFRFCV